MSDGAGLRVLIDGAALSETEGRAFWRRFSEWMEEHAGDLAGFARREGLASVHPEMHAGAAVLVASRTAPQKAYGPVTNEPAGQSGSRSARREKPPRRRSRRRVAERTRAGHR